MANKSDFTTKEWELLLEGAMATSIAVTSADPSGVRGVLEEGEAAASAIRLARTHANPLVAALAEELDTTDGRQAVHDRLQKRLAGNQAIDIKAGSLEALRGSAMLLDRKAPQDTEIVKQWFEMIAQAAAEAVKEGGFLGLGGVPVSESERATLEEISQALGRSGPAA